MPLRSLARMSCAFALSMGFLGVAPDARAAWPDRPIKLVVPFAPGGGSDLIARIIATPLSQALGQSVVVENHPGANGNIGIGIVAKADPDGYTLLVASSVIFVNPTLSKSANYDPQKDFAPIADLGGSPNALVTRADSGINSVGDLIARAKAEPDRFNFSSPGVGSISQLGVELLKLRAGIKLTHVPYTGAGPAVQAVLSGTTQLACVNISSLIPHIKAGTLRGLVQTGKERWAELPDIPTLAEAGVPNAASETLQILVAPARTPPEVVDQIAKAVVEILKRPEIRERMLQTGFAVAGTGPDALRKRVAEEVATWQEVISQAKLKAE
jgi:tripartite-type tricarboxylate transporter receptor subunit TctC